MKRFQLHALTALGMLALAGAPADAHVRWSVGVRFGGPCFAPCWGPVVGFRYYEPYPVYVAPAPLVYQPAPVVVQPAPAVLQASPTVVTPPPAYQSASSPAGDDNSIEYHLQMLSNGDEKVRADAVLELGRHKAYRAVDALCASLAGDRSPAVREAAARALGLIASEKALPALTRAAQVDNDRDVRRSAQFAVEIIHTNLRRN